MKQKRLHAREQARQQAALRGKSDARPARKISGKKALSAVLVLLCLGVCGIAALCFHHRISARQQGRDARQAPLPDYQLVIPSYHSGAVQQLVFRPDGKVLATVGADGAVKVWDVDHGVELATLKADREAIQCLAFSPDGRLLLGGSSGSKIFVWDQSWNCSRRLPAPGPEGVTQIGFTANGQFLVASLGDNAIVYNAQKNFEVFEGLFQNQMPRYITKSSWESGFRFSLFAFAHVGSLMAMTGGPQAMIDVPPSQSEGKSIPISVTDLGATSNQQTMLLGHGFRYSGVPMPPATLSRPGKSVGFSLKGMRTVLSVAFSPSGKELLSASDDFTVRIWNISTAKARLVIPSASPAWGAIYSPIGNLIAAGYSDGEREAIRLELRSATDGHLVRTLTRNIKQPNDLHPFQSSVAFSPDGQFIAAAGITTTDEYGLQHEGVTVWRVSDGRMVYSASSNMLTQAAFSPDGRVLAAGGGMGNVSLWETKNWKSLSMHIPDDEDDLNFSLGNEGKGIACGSDGNNPVYSLNDGKPVPGLLQSSEKAVRVGIPGSNLVLSVSGNGTARCWNLLSRKLQCQIELPSPAVSVRDLIVGEHTQRVETRTGIMAFSVRRAGPGSYLGVGYNPMETSVKIGPIGHDSSLVAASSGMMLALGTSESRKLNVYDLSHGSIIHHLDLPPGKLSQVGYVDKGRIVYGLTRFWGTGNPLDRHHKWETETITVVAWDAGTGHLLSRFVTHGVLPYACGCPGGTSLLALRTYNQVQFLDLRRCIKRNVINLLDRIRVPTTGYIGLPADYDLSSLAGKTMPIVMTHAAIALSSDGRVLAAEDASGTFELWDTSTSRMTYASYGYETSAQGYETSRPRQNQIDYPPAWSQYIGFTQDNKKVIYGTLSGDIVLRNVSQPQTSIVFKGHVGPAHPIGFNNATQTVLVTAGQDGVRFWRVSDAKQLLHMVVLTPRSWIAAAPDGRFDGTSEGISQTYFVRGGIRASVRSLFHRFYTPGIIRKAFLNELGEIKTETDDVSLGERPSVLIGQGNEVASTARVALPTTVEAHGRPVTAFLAFVNEKLVYREAISLQPWQHKLATIPVNLVPGDNLVEIFAVDDQQVWSNGASVRIARTGSAPESDLYIVSVGINTYRDKPLQFARRDAVRVANAFQLAGRGIYRRVFSISLLDGQARRADIDAAIRRIERHAQSQDAFVFYFSGHGLVTARDGEQTTMLAGAGLTDFSDPSVCQSEGIPLMQIRDWIKDLLPQRQLWLFDACNSGTLARSLEDFTSTKDFQELQFGTGVYFAAAARPADSEVANEYPRVRSGLFTQVLLDGLNTPGSSHDGNISVTDLGHYILNRLPQYSQSLIKDVQQPAFWDPQSVSAYRFMFSRRTPGLVASSRKVMDP